MKKQIFNIQTAVKMEDFRRANMSVAVQADDFCEAKELALDVLSHEMVDHKLSDLNNKATQVYYYHMPCTENEEYLAAKYGYWITELFDEVGDMFPDAERPDSMDEPARQLNIIITNMATGWQDDVPIQLEYTSTLIKEVRLAAQSYLEYLWEHGERDYGDIRDLKVAAWDYGSLNKHLDELFVV
jgi:hypothetical protein